MSGPGHNSSGISAGRDIARAIDTYRERREASGLSQQYIADKVGVGCRSITGYEIAERTPTLETFACMLAAVGMRLTVEDVK